MGAGIKLESDSLPFPVTGKGSACAGAIPQTLHRRAFALNLSLSKSRGEHMHHARRRRTSRYPGLDPAPIERGADASRICFGRQPQTSSERLYAAAPKTAEISVRAAA